LYVFAFSLWRLTLKNLETYKRELLIQHYIVARDVIEKVREREAVASSHSYTVGKLYSDKNENLGEYKRGPSSDDKLRF